MSANEELESRPSESITSPDVVVESSITVDNSFASKLNAASTTTKNSFEGNTQIPEDLEEIKINGTKRSDSPSSSESQNISIVSLDEDADSSVIDSDSEFEDAPPRDLVTRNLGQRVNKAEEGAIVINQQINGIPSCSGAVAGKPQIGSIAVQNSTDITFGSKTFYQGPVTIKQFLLENKKWRPTEDGTDNPAFDVEDNKTENDHDDGNSKPEANLLNLWRRKLPLHSKAGAITCVIILVTVLLGAITLTTISFRKSTPYNNNSGDGEDSRKNVPINSTIGNDNIAGGRVLRIVTRDEWIAQPPNNPLDPLELPVNRVIITHTATEGCTTQAACTFRVRFIQTFHMESRNFDDIGYNFLVGGDGSVYVGRGWDKQGAHTKGYNKGSIGIAFIGTFIKNPPPESQLRACHLLIQEGVRLRKLTENYKLYGHRQLIPSESPGEALYKIIQTWPHWSNEIDAN